MIKNKGTKILILSLTFSGLLSTSTGIVLNNMKVNTSSSKIDVKVVEKQVARLKSNVPTLKELEVEINEPISVDVKDYISNIDDISSNVLRAFKLDTSLVNVTQPGKYTYYIQYNNKKYKGSLIVKDKEEEKKIETLHVKNFSIKVNEALPTDPLAYLEDKSDTLDINKLIFDTTKVDNHVAGQYQYTVTYGKMLYTGTITVYEEQATQVLNKIEYTVTYVCGEESIGPKPYTKTSTTKNVLLEETDVIGNKPSTFTSCTSEIDYNLTKVKFPLLVENNGGFKVYFKAKAVTPVQPQTPVVDSNENTQN